MLQTLRKELEKYDVFSAPNHELVDSIVRAISFTTVPAKMKLTFVIAHLSHFASQFRRNIHLWDGTPVPVNSISFVIADSGANKDSSHSKVRRCLQPGHDLIYNHLEKEVIRQAIRKAESAGEELPEEYAVYKNYLKPIPPVFMSITTGPGLVQHINDIGDLPSGSGLVYSGEFSDELANNINTLDNIKTLAEVYDLGNKEVTYTKGIEFRSKEINGQPVSALFVGSPGHILYDEATKKKFHVAFMSKLARRTWFCYTPERMYEPDFSQEADPIKAMKAYEQSIIDEAKEATAAVRSTIELITKHNLTKLGDPVNVSPEVADMFTVYKRYNREVVDSLPNQESTYALVRGHLQWKALKLAGAIAILDCSDTVQAAHYATAIKFAEILDTDIIQFEHDLNKAPHERMSDYLHLIVGQDNRAFISTHDIKKNGYSSTVSLSKLQELVTLCAGYDPTGIYSVANEAGGIQFEPLIKTDVLGISYKPINTASLNRAVELGDEDLLRQAKHDISVTTAYGYELLDATFEELGDLLQGDFAYSPFKFRNGVRGRNNILGGTKWLVLDIDNSPLSASEAHFMLGGINHHIALSSNPNNEFKFRVLIELDSSVELSPVAWKHFYLKIAEDLALQVDPLPQSQIFFSYANRPVLSVTDSEPLEVRDYVMYAKEKETVKVTQDKSLTSSQKQTMLDDPLTTFDFAFNAPSGQGSVSMYRAARYAQDLGAHLEYVLSLLDDINTYWISPMEYQRLEALKEQVTRLYQGH